MTAVDFDPDFFDECRAQRYRDLASTLVDPQKAALFADVATRLETRLTNYYQWKREHSLRSLCAPVTLASERG